MNDVCWVFGVESAGIFIVEISGELAVRSEGLMEVDHTL